MWLAVNFCSLYCVIMEMHFVMETSTSINVCLVFSHCGWILVLKWQKKKVTCISYTPKQVWYFVLVITWDQGQGWARSFVTKAVLHVEISPRWLLWPTHTLGDNLCTSVRAYLSFVNFVYRKKATRKLTDKKYFNVS